MCVQASCMKLICERCKTSTHKHHQFMEFDVYKQKYLEELQKYTKYLNPYLKSTNQLKEATTHLVNETIDRQAQEDIVQVKRRRVGSQSTVEEYEDTTVESLRGRELHEGLVKQCSMVQKCMENIEAVDFSLDPIEGIGLIKDTFNMIREVYQEDQNLLKNMETKENQHSALKYPKVKIDCGIDTSEVKECLVACRNGDVVVAGSDTLQKTWFIRRFTRLGRLVWNKPLPLSWAAVDGMVEYHTGNDQGLLLSDADHRKIIFVTNNKTTTCYADDEKAPGAMCCSEDFKRLFFKDRVFDFDEGRIEILDTTTKHFVSLVTLKLGFTYSNEMGYMSSRDLLFVTSHKKFSVRALNAVDGAEVWTLGQHVLGKTFYPRGACTDNRGNWCCLSCTLVIPPLSLPPSIIVPKKTLSEHPLQRFQWQI